MAGKIVQIAFSYNLAVLQGVLLEEDVPFAGYINSVCLHWPEGCNGLVSIKVGHGVEQFCPREGYLALNDATPTYLFNEGVNDHDVIWVEMQNADGINAHRIVVTVTLEAME